LRRALNLGEADEPDVAAPEHDFARGIIVRHHADDDIAFKQLVKSVVGLR
jgi:hypothetical protein